MVKWSLSKWSKYKVLKKSKPLIPYLPKTYWMKKSTFWRLLAKFDEVIVKPSGSSGGNGVLLIKSLDNQEFEVQSGDKKKKISGKTNLFEYVKKKTSLHCIVQRRISLASVNKRPFDLRVMVQRRRNTSWKVTGKLAKVAGKGYIITNMLRSNGMILPVERAIQRSQLKGISAAGLLSHIDRIALDAAKQLARYYPAVRTIGVDMGIEKTGRPWIIEANFRPSSSLFLKLNNKSVYKEIVSYRK